MDLGSPLTDVIPGTRGRLLATLAQLERPVAVRALARYSGVSPQTALNLVGDLAGSGVVTVERAGQALMVALNRSHLLAEPVTALAAARLRLVERLRGELAAWPALAGAWMFGSAARGDGGRSSDIDLLLVADTNAASADWVEATARLVGMVRSWTGNDAQLVEHTRDSLARLVEERSQLLSHVRSEGIPLTAASDRLLRPSG